MDKEYIVLGVAFNWDNRKGLDVFIKLAELLPARYKIVLVGTNEQIDTKLPLNIISIHRTQDKKELVDLYSAADVFVNPTREDTFPTVNLEALACGTPVVTFKVGGSPEMLDDETGSVVECEDIDELINEIIRCSSSIDSKHCVEKASLYNQSSLFKEYVRLFQPLICD